MKIFAKFTIAPGAEKHSPEADVAAMIASPEKTAHFKSQVEADRAATAPNTRRYLHLNRQLDELKRVELRHQVESERQRVAAALQSHKAAADKALEQALESLASADGDLADQRKLYEAGLARLEPLETAKTMALKSAADEVIAAEKDFAAIAGKGDEAAEIAASERLYQVKSNGKNAAGPLSLRLAAAMRDEIDAKQAMIVSEDARQNAEKAVELARANVRLIAYSGLAQPLLDAYVEEEIAVAACGRKYFSGRAIGQFSVQVSCADHIVFGTRMDAYANRVLPMHIVREIIAALSTAPNLLLLSTPADSIVEPSPEPPEDRRLRTSVSAVLRPDGTVEEQFIDLPEEPAGASRAQAE